MSHQLCTCTNCGWVHMAYTREDAEQSVLVFNRYYDTLTPALQQDYYGGKASSVEDYEGCGFCGGYEFRHYEDGDCPEGVTIGPVIWEGA